MNVKQQFEKHFPKLRLEAWIRALCAGLIVGFSVGFVAAALTWFTNLNGLWIPILAILVATAVSMPIYYTKKFRPTAEKSARRIDRLGLEERLITMVEYAEDQSFIANIQREDAKQKLDEVETSRIKFKMPKKTLVALCVTGVLGVGMSVVTALATLGLLPSGMQMWEEITPEEPIQYVSVTYEVYEGGMIDGEADQLIPMGSSTSMVVAVADEGYEFQGWSDEYSKPDRSDSGITEDVVYVAIFMPLDGQPSEDGDPSEDEDQEQPQESQEESESQNPEDNPDAPQMNTGKYEEANQIIDGVTYYREVLEEYVNLLIERLETEGGTLTDEERAIIEAYLEVV